MCANVKFKNQNIIYIPGVIETQAEKHSICDTLVAN